MRCTPCRHAVSSRSRTSSGTGIEQPPRVAGVREIVEPSNLPCNLPCRCSLCPSFLLQLRLSRSLSLYTFIGRGLHSLRRPPHRHQRPPPPPPPRRLFTSFRQPFRKLYADGGSPASSSPWIGENRLLAAHPSIVAFLSADNY